ncbi:uncharacterized protein LOC102676728 isoform X2 [Apis dorsata]|uniref:uncharacterized protein LOC102676728 isoform X2 n=1 Tax=Apis dorsata TaxID=7462 RepID=UPI0003DF6ED6|nr:uncharacterized protein LOC102676728 isoform X2 [Apis dorsata]
MSEKRGTKALELWCRRITEGYPDVNVQNMTTSWKDGLAFCAMIHHFRPDLIDFDNLDKNDVYGNNELAFRVAEQHLGIPALLDAEDMASCAVPDRLSILTYLSQFYQTFSGSSPTRHPVSRTTETTEERITQVPESPKEKEASYLGMRKDRCVVCGLPIFLAEKLVLARVAYHRTCFRCARCNNQLTIGNYYETEEGQYCCETCPDEEIPVAITRNCDESSQFNRVEKNKIDSNYQQFLSDEKHIDKRIFSLDPVNKLDHRDRIVPDLLAQTSRLRFNFISNQLLFEEGEQKFLANNTNATNENQSNFDRSTNFTSSANRKSESENDGNNELDSSKLESAFTSLKLESVDKENITKTNDYDDYYVESSTNERDEQKSANSFQFDSITDKSPCESNDQSVERIQRDKNTSSIIEKTIRIFDKTRQDEIKVYNNEDRDIETLNRKIQMKEYDVIGKSEKISMINPDATETIIGQNAALKDNVETDDSTQMDTFEQSLAHATEINENLSIISDTTNREFETCTTVATNINSNLNEDYPEDLNPFKSDEEEEEEEKISDKYMTIVNTTESSKILTNPFENEEEIKRKEIIPPRPAVRSNFNGNTVNRQFSKERPTKRRLAAPQINLNPFWSDEDDHNSDLESKEKTCEMMPTPKPRTIKHDEGINVTERQESSQNHHHSRTSNNNIRSPESNIRIGGTYRKKKPAPLPPTKKESCLSDQPSMSKESCVHVTPKMRKTKPAPPPPPPPLPSASSSSSPTVLATSNFEGSSINRSSAWEDQKTNKDETNRNRQSFTHMSCEENFHYMSYLDKSMEGKWKRKKGPAPPCPIPHKRKIKVMSLKDVKLELDEIEVQQQGLEKQGVRLEQLIRSKCESGSRTDNISLATDVEELVLELFTLVNEKNELFRRQAELMLLRRQQRLEEEHAEVEYQIRCLMMQHDSTKTDFDKQREEALIQRLVEIVERRNEIVDCLEMDRRREMEEDWSIHHHMDLFVAKNKNESSLCNDKDITEKKKRKQNKQKEKIKEKKLKKISKKDIDKDVDEIELTLKRHTKRKWF